jgi:hypothetical protein
MRSAHKQTVWGYKKYKERNRVGSKNVVLTDTHTHHTQGWGES